jgi:hypothetical protein
MHLITPLCCRWTALEPYEDESSPQITWRALKALLSKALTTAMIFLKIISLGGENLPATHPSGYVRLKGNQAGNQGDNTIAFNSEREGVEPSRTTSRNLASIHLTIRSSFLTPWGKFPPPLFRGGI